MLWHIELKFCTWLCSNVLQIKFECRQFVSIFVGVMPLLELQIHSFPHFSLTCFDMLSWNFAYDFVLLYYRSSSSVVNFCVSYAPFGTQNTENIQFSALFSAPEPKAQVHYCDHALSVVRPSVVRPSLTLHIFNFFSETSERNSTKLDRKQDLNVLYQVCVFRADRKNKMAALASDWLRHFRLLLWNRSTEFNETRQEARSQCPLPSLCFSGRSEKQDGRPGLWLAETFSTSSLKPLNGIQWNLTGSKISMSSTKFVFFGPIGKTRWPPWSLIGWDIFDFFSETAEWNSTKLDRKQDLNVLYQVCVFRADRKNKMAALASDWLRHFRLLLWNRWTEFNETWQEARSERPLPSLWFLGRSEKQDGRHGLWLAETFSTSSLKPLNGIQWNLTGSKISMSSTKFVFFGPIGKTRWPPWPLIGWDIFDFFSETAERNSTKLDRKQDLNVLYQVCDFWADRKNKMAAMASDWLRHFRLLLWNRWTEFNETWQEARSQCLLLSLCFSGRSEKQDGRPGLWLAETFSTSPLKPLNGIQRNSTGSKISTSSTKFVFLAPIRKTRWPPWPLIGWDIFDFSSETAERNSTKLDRKQDLNVLYQVCVFGAEWKNKMAALTPDWLRHFRLLWNCWTEFNEIWQEARSQHLLPSLCFSGRWVNKNFRPGWFVKKVAHCTQVHDMWPFGPLVSDMLWLIELKICAWLCFTEIKINFDCRQFVSIFCGSYAPFETLNTWNTQFTFLSHALAYWAKIFMWLSLMYYRSSLSVVTLCPSILSEI